MFIGWLNVGGLSEIQFMSFRKQTLREGLGFRMFTREGGETGFGRRRGTAALQA